MRHARWNATCIIGISSSDSDEDDEDDDHDDEHNDEGSSSVVKSSTGVEVDELSRKWPLFGPKSSEYVGSTKNSRLSQRRTSTKARQSRKPNNMSSKVCQSTPWLHTACSPLYSESCFHFDAPFCFSPRRLRSLLSQALVSSGNLFDRFSKINEFNTLFACTAPISSYSRAIGHS